MRIRRSVKWVAPLAALALFAGACSGGGGAEKDEIKSLDDIPAADVNQKSRDDVKDGGELNWAVPEFITQFNRYHTDGNLGVNTDIILSMLPRAFKYDEKGTPEPVKEYVEEGTLSDDGKTLTFKLNPEAKWSDGKPITWEDYAEQVEALADRNKGDYENGGPASGYDRISKTAKGGENEVVFTFSEPYAEWPSLFEPLYPKEYMGDAKKFNEGYFEDLPVTAGPFNLEKIDKTAQRVSVTRNDDWWGEPAKLDGITYHTYESDAMAGVFVNKEIDAFYAGYDAPTLERAKERKDGRVTKAIDNGYRYVEVNGDRKFLKDIKVRHAIAKGIDRSALAAASMKGIGWPSDPAGNRLLRSSQTGYQDNSGEWGKQDTEAAAKLLDEAGWKQSGEGEVRTKGKDKLELDYVLPSGLQTTQNEAEIVQEQLKPLGIQVNVEAVPSTAFFTEYIYTGDFDLSSFVQVGTTPYAGDSYENFGGPFGDKGGKPDWGNNNGRTSTPEINDKFDELVKETDPKKYAELANEIDKAIWDNGQALVIFQRTGTWGVRKDLANFGAFGLSSRDYEDIGFVKE